MKAPDRVLVSGARRWVPVIPALLLALAGYFGPWIPHRAAGLVLTGVDFAEVVKFIPQVLSGQVTLLRESFYVPLVAGSLIATFVAGRRSLPVWLRILAGLAAIPLALAMLPPAWSPGRLLQPEFRIQMLAIAVCLLAIPLIGATRFLPDALVLVFVTVLALVAAVWPARGFLQLLPPLRELYHTDDLLIGWGFVLSVASWLAVAFLALAAALRRPRPARRPL